MASQPQREGRYPLALFSIAFALFHNYSNLNLDGFELGVAGRSRKRPGKRPGKRRDDVQENRGRRGKVEENVAKDVEHFYFST